MKPKTICPRCHRLKSIRGGERYCDKCLELRAQEEAPKKHGLLDPIKEPSE